MPLSLNRFRYGTGLDPELELPAVGKPRTAAERRTAAEPPPLPDTARIWPTGPILNQGRLGACSGFSTTGDLIAEPAAQLDVTAKTGNAHGVNLYKRARVLAGHTPLPAAGDTSRGSSIFLNLDACIERGLATGYYRPATVEDVAVAIVNDGPVILGLRWVNSFGQTAKNGLMKYRPDDADRGYHAITAIGYHPAKSLPQPDRWVRGKRRPQPPLPPEPMFLLRNSWGTGWGALTRKGWERPWKFPERNGNGWLRLRDLRHLWDARQAYGYVMEGRAPVDLAAVLAAFPDPYQPPPPPRDWR